MEELILNYFNLFLESDFKYVLMFFIGLFEGMPVIGSFIPGGTISFLIGSQVPSGLFNPWLSFVILGFANFIGDFAGFIFGRYSHRIRFIRKIVDQEKLHTAWEIFDKNLFYFAVLGRLIPVVRSMPSLLAGAKMVKIKRYLPLSIFGSFLWAFAGVFGGALVGEIFGEFAAGIIIFVTVFVILLSLIRKKLLKYGLYK